MNFANLLQNFITSFPMLSCKGLSEAMYILELLPTMTVELLGQVVPEVYDCIYAGRLQRMLSSPCILLDMDLSSIIEVWILALPVTKKLAYAVRCSRQKATFKAHAVTFWSVTAFTISNKGLGTYGKATQVIRLSSPICCIQKSCCPAGGVPSSGLTHQGTLKWVFYQQKRV